MKKNLLKCTAILLASVMMLPSCSNEEKGINSDEISNLLSLSKQLKILENQYVSSQPLTKGPVSNTVAVVGADQLGWHAGSREERG